MEKIRNSLLLPGLAGFFERFSYYGIRTLLVIYLVSPELSKITILLGSTLLIGILRPFGGFITDRYLGTKRSLLVANSFIILGIVLLYFSLKTLLIPGSVFIILGSALFAPANLKIILNQQKSTHFRTDSWVSLYFTFVTIGLFLGESSLTTITNTLSLETGLLLCLGSSICSFIFAIMFLGDEEKNTSETVTTTPRNNAPLIAGLFIAILMFWIADSLTSLNYSYHLTSHSTNDFPRIITTLVSLLGGLLLFFLWRYVAIPTVYKWISGLIVGGIVAFLPLLENDFYNTLWLNSFCITLLTISEILTGALTYTLLKNISSKKNLATIIGTGLFFESIGAIIVYKWLPDMNLRSTTEAFLSTALYLIPAIIALLFLYFMKKRKQSEQNNELIDR